MFGFWNVKVYGLYGDYFKIELREVKDVFFFRGKVGIGFRFLGFRFVFYYL